MYVIRTSVCAEVLDDSETVKAYKSLSQVEQAFRCYKTIDLNMRLIYHRASPTGYDRTCFDVGWLITWNGICGARLAPLLFEDEERLDTGRVWFGGTSPMRECDRAQAATYGSSSCRLLLNLVFVTRDYQQ